jgi:cell filamentation protein
MNKYYYEYKDDGDVMYCYPSTQTLVNKFDIRDGAELAKVEREISIVKAAVLTDAITGKFDLNHLKSIHKFLFEDIYNWAGKIRTVDIAKGHVFCLVQFIEQQFDDLYAELKKDNFLKDADEDEMLDASATSFMCDYTLMDILIRKCIKEIEEV